MAEGKGGNQGLEEEEEEVVWRDSWKRTGAAQSGRMSKREQMHKGSRVRRLQALGYTGTGGRTGERGEWGSTVL